MNAMGMSRRNSGLACLARVLAVGLAGVLATSGCERVAQRSGDAPGGRADAATGGPVGAAASNEAGGHNAASTEVRVDRSYWYAGFKVTLGVARVIAPSDSSGDAPPVVAIDAAFQNLGPDNRTPDADTLLTSGAESYNEKSSKYADLPEVPGMHSKTGVIAIEVDDRFKLTDAVLTVGEPKFRQAVVPLSQADGLISLEPRPITVSGRVYPRRRENVFMTLTGGEVRADDPSQHHEARSGEEYVMLSFTATNNGPGVMVYVFDWQLSLTLPDGTSAAAEVGCSRAQVNIGPHSTARPDGMACFAVPAPATGDYRLLWQKADKNGQRFSIS